MSINPVPNIEPAAETSFASYDSHGAQSPTPNPIRKVQPDSGSSPNPEPAEARSVPSPSEVPQDEVEVQRDSQTNGEIVVRYVDHSGDLILQVPSEQVLNVTRSIDQDLEHQQQVHARSEATVGSYKGGKSDGH
jgi:hypothetical protein